MKRAFFGYSSSFLCTITTTSFLPREIVQCAIPPFQDNRLSKMRNKLLSVPRRGLEPPSPCGRYHLKVVRLPISPPGQLRDTINEKPPIAKRLAVFPTKIYAATSVFSSATASACMSDSSLFIFIMRALRSWRRTALVAFSRMK